MRLLTFRIIKNDLSAFVEFYPKREKYICVLPDGKKVAKSVQDACILACKLLRDGYLEVVPGPTMGWEKLAELYVGAMIELEIYRAEPPDGHTWARRKAALDEYNNAADALNRERRKQ